MTAAKQATTKGFAFEMNFKVWGFPGMLVVKNLPAEAGEVREAGSIPGGKDPLGEEMETHPSILAWRVPWTEEPGGLQSIGLHRVGHDGMT